MVRVADVRRAAEFWSKALGYRPRDGQIRKDFVVLVSRDGNGVGLALDRSDSTPEEEPALHLDLYTHSTDEQRSEIERLVALGAQRVDWPHYPEDPDFVVLADTEGNRFCVVDSSHG